MKALKHVAGVLLATFGITLILGMVALIFDPDPDIPPWLVVVMILLFGLLPLRGAFVLLRRTLMAPSRACPQCGGTERQAAGVLRRSHSLWAFHFWGWFVASLWGASRAQQVKCCGCETLYLTDTRATRIAGVLLWVFLLLMLLGVLAEVFKGH